MLQCLTHDSNLVPSSRLYVPFTRLQLRLIFLLLTLFAHYSPPSSPLTNPSCFPLLCFVCSLFLPALWCSASPARGCWAKGAMCHSDTEHSQEYSGIWIFSTGIPCPTPELSCTVNPKQSIIRLFGISVLEKDPAFPKPSPVSDLIWFDLIWGHHLRETTKSPFSLKSL